MMEDPCVTAHGPLVTRHRPSDGCNLCLSAIVSGGCWKVRFALAIIFPALRSECKFCQSSELRRQPCLVAETSDSSRPSRLQPIPPILLDKSLSLHIPARTPSGNMPPNPLTLKQRLAALSANINSPSRSTFDMPPDSPITSKRKSFFKQPFSKSSNSDAAPSGYYGQERIQEVMSRLIFQAGVDYECVLLLIRTRLVSLLIMHLGHGLCVSSHSRISTR